jgi:Basic leucine-zipper C terminal
MAEDKDKRETWLDDELYHTISDISAMAKPFSLGPPDEISDVLVQSKGVAGVFCELNNDFIDPSHIDPTGMVINRSDTKMGRSCSLKRVASLECLQKRMHGESSSSDLNQWGASVRYGNEAPDKHN